MTQEIRKQRRRDKNNGRKLNRTKKPFTQNPLSLCVNGPKLPFPMFYSIIIRCLELY